MTREEEKALWNLYIGCRKNAKVCGKRVKHWLTIDGDNDILLEGETVYRTVVIKG